ncbi:MAG: 2-oxo acid dehydrogenase subunit E2 [Anaerolineae bacterium]|nr:2-oxo acid dehydrogenase subunit E2 [Anaerolineae bacterium]
MPTNVIMPQLGESVVEGTVSKWLKQEGDAISEFEPLLEISTDKVDTEIPAPAGGVLLKILIPAGETVERGTLLAVIGQAGEAVGESPVAARPATSATTPVANGHATPEQVAAPAVVVENTGHVTPVVARMVAEHHLDLAQIMGTGRDGRVTKKDVEAYLAARPTAPTADDTAADDTPPWERPGSGDLFKSTQDYDDTETPALETPVGTRHASSTPPPAPPRIQGGETTPPASQSTRVHPVEPIPTASPGDLVPLTGMRRAIADHMVRSKHTSPHVTTIFEVDLSAVLAHRTAHKDSYAKQGVNLTLTAYFVSATVEALRAVPYLNGQWTDDGIFLHRVQNIGVAVALEEGLIVPVIKNAGDYNLLGLARLVNDVATRARSKQLKPDEVKDGTFTITNHGVSGSLVAMPIINQPQVGILGVGMLEKRVKVITDALGNDSIAIRPCVYVSLTFDHRVVDGAAGDAFLLKLKQTLEGWK